MNLAAGVYEVETSDGVVRRQVQDVSPIPLPQHFRKVTFAAAEHTMTMTTLSGDDLTVEVFDDDDQRERIAGRPVVYLDQNKWVRLAQSVHSPEKLVDAEVTAAHELIRLAKSHRVILPLSSGHLIETCPTDRAWRVHMAELMISLSRGWLMSDPLLVRSAELLSLFAKRSGGPAAPVGDVITLNPFELFGDRLDDSPGATDLPEAIRRLPVILSAVAAVFSVLVEDEGIRSEEGVERSRAWAKSHHELAKELKTNAKARALARDVTRLRFLSDLSLDLDHAADGSGLAREAIWEWLTDQAESDLATLPYLGRMREVIHLRLMDAGDEWDGNDLVDMMYLPCAAAYADFVVGEKKALHYLNRACRGRSDGAVLLTSLSELMERLVPAPLPATSLDYSLSK